MQIFCIISLSFILSLCYPIFYQPSPPFYLKPPSFLSQPQSEGENVFQRIHAARSHTSRSSRIEHLVKILTETHNITAKNDILHLFSRQRAWEALPAVLKILQDPEIDPIVLKTVIASLADIGTSNNLEVAAILLKYASHGLDEETQRIAQEAIILLGIKEIDFSAREMLLNALRQINSPWTPPEEILPLLKLIARLQTYDKSISRDTGLQDKISNCLRVLLDKHPNYSIINVEVWMTLKRTSPLLLEPTFLAHVDSLPRNAQDLIPAIKQRSDQPFKALAALEILARPTNEEIPSWLEDPVVYSTVISTFLESPNPLFQEKALYALLNIGQTGQMIPSAIIQMGLDSPFEPVHEAAVKIDRALKIAAPPSPEEITTDVSLVGKRSLSELFGNAALLSQL